MEMDLEEGEKGEKMEEEKRVLVKSEVYTEDEKREAFKKKLRKYSDKEALEKLE